MIICISCLPIDGFLHDRERVNGVAYVDWRQRGHIPISSWPLPYTFAYYEDTDFITGGKSYKNVASTMKVFLGPWPLNLSQPQCKHRKSRSSKASFHVGERFGQFPLAHRLWYFISSVLHPHNSTQLSRNLIHSTILHHRASTLVFLFGRSFW